MDGFLVDILRGDEVIEVQTGSFSKVAGKLRRLSESRPVTLCYPIALQKWITHISPDGEILRRRKSPAKGSLLGLFQEMVSIPDLVARPEFSLEVLLIREDEVRCPDGKGSWRRRGVSRIDRRLLEVEKSVLFRDASDFLSLVPEGIRVPFTNSQLGEASGLSAARARRMSYALRRMGALDVAGKAGRELLFTPRIRASAPRTRLWQAPAVPAGNTTDKNKKV